MNREPSYRHQIDILCDQFEQALKTGERPSIEELLEAIDASQRLDLLAELLPLDVHYRSQSGELVSAEAYRQRFGDASHVVEEVFARLDEPRNPASSQTPLDHEGLADTLAGEPDAMDDATLPPRAVEMVSDAFEEPTLPPGAMMADDVTIPPQPLSHDATLPPESPHASSSDAEPSNWKAGGTIKYFGDYELLSEIARGGMGVVYRARQSSLNRIVALKMILSGQLAGEQEVQRFHAEAEAAANLDHPGIVPIYEVGEYEGQHYFSMGFIDGESLSDLIADKPMAPREAAELTMKIADAIGYAHEQGVIHRDLKPANVLVQKRAEGSESKSKLSMSASTISGSQANLSGLSPRVTDFGLAKQIEGDDQLTASGQILGTPSYMPPEQASGKIDQIDQRSDVYSLGGILYALITGRAPFQAASHLDTLMQVLEKEPVPPRQMDPKLPRDIETIALKALEKDPKRRYQTAGELSEDLGRFLNGEPIHARSITPIERGWRWARRKPIVAGLGALAATLLLVVSIGGPITAIRQASLRSLAEDREREATLAQGKAEEAAEMEKAAKVALADEKERAERTLYARTIALAYQAWHNDNVHRAEDLLNKTDHRFRDWEWNYISKLCNSEEQTLHGHVGIPFRMRMTADGKHLVSLGSAQVTPDANVYVWDVETGTVVKKIAYRGFAISPDGKRVAVEMREDGPIVILDVMTEKRLGEVPAHGGGTAWANFNSDGTRLVTTGPDSSVRIWNIETAEKLLDLHDASRRRVHDVNFSGDDRLLYWKTFEGLIQIHNAETGEKLKEIDDPIYRADAVRVAISPDNRILAAGSNGPINLFRLPSGEKIATLYGHRSSVLGLGFSPDGRRIASSGVDGTVRVWDVEERRESFRYRGHKFGVVYGVYEVVYSNDGKWIISGGADRTIKIWSADAGDGFPRELALQSADDLDRVQAASVYPDPSQDRDWLVGNTNYVDAVVFSPDGKLAATACEDDTVRVYDIATRRNIYTFTGHKQSVAAVAFHPDGELIASGEGGLNDHRNGKILLWDRNTGDVRASLEGHGGPVSNLCFSPDGNVLYSASGSQRVPHRGEVIAWDLDEGKLLYKYENVTGVRVMDIRPDGQQLAVAQYRGPVHLLDARSGELSRKVGGDEIFFAVAYSADGRRLATGKNSWAVAVWDLDSGKRVWEQIEHSGAIMGVAFNPSGTRVVSTSVDRTTKMWDAHSGDMLVDLRGDAFELFGVAISPDGNTIASYGEAPYVTLRGLDSGISQVSELEPQDEWPVIFEDDFDRQELGDKWTVSGGKWNLVNGAAMGMLAPLPSIPGFSACTIIPKSWMPSVVSIEYEVWAHKRVLFETKLNNESSTDGVDSLFIANNTPFNQGRRGAAVLVTANFGFNEVARNAESDWFQPNQRYKLKTVRNRGRWEMFIDGKPVLETEVPPQLWAPVMHLQASFANPGSTIYVDNVVVRAPKSMQDEIEATGLEWQLRQDLKLKALVLHAIESDDEISESVRKLATRYARLQKEDPATRRKLIRAAVLAGDIDQGIYRQLAEGLAEDVKLSEDDWQSRQLLAASWYRAGDYEPAMKALKDAEMTFQRQSGMSHPINLALLSMTSQATGNTQRALVAMDRLKELMRSNHWKSDEYVVGWSKQALEAVPQPAPQNADLAAEIESIKVLTFSPQQQALCQGNLEDYMATFTEDAVQIDGRSNSPTKYDLQFPIAKWKEAQRVFASGGPSLHARLVRNRADVEVDGDQATLRGDYTFSIPNAYWRWQSEEKLRKTDAGWKIHRRRHGLTASGMGGQKFVSQPGDWAKLDAEVEEARKADDDVRLVFPLVKAHHLQEAFDLLTNLTEAEETASAADIWSGLADRAFGVADADEMIRAGTKAVQLDPTVNGPPFIRALAVKQHLPDKPLDIGNGIAVRTPTFINEAPNRDFSVPGKVLRSWYPSNRSGLIVFYGEDDMDEESLEVVMEKLVQQLQMALQIQIHRKELTSVAGLEAIDLIIEGYGTGRSISRTQGKSEGTVQRWIVALRDKDLIGFLLTAGRQEFDMRNAEFETWLKYVEIDRSGNGDPQKNTNANGISAR